MAALFAAITISANAQFLSMGGERGTIRWSQTETPDYRVIYPAGMDSLAFHYGALLQYYRTDVGRSAGYLPNEKWSTPLPVVLHPFNGEANGAVIETPRRMELFTMPDAYGQVAPMPWELNLAIHENRHVAQSQFAYDRVWGWMNYITGELFTMYIMSFYANMAMLEGDAVVAETALTQSGRGRTADFLGYYRMAFDQGDYRNWYQWRYGSLNRYYPNHYALGYMTVAGARTTYNAPYYMANYLGRLTHPWGINAVVSATKHYSGKKFSKSWNEIVSNFQDEWMRDDELRGPFQDLNVLTPSKKGFTGYRGAVAVSDNRRILAIRTALNSDPQLVEIGPGGVKSIRPFSASSRLAYSEETRTIYWTDEIPDARWEFETHSPIQMMDLSTRRVKNFATDGRYVNPSVSPDGLSLVAVEYPIEGGSNIVVFDIRSREKELSIPAAAGMQVTEAVLWDGKLVFSGIDEKGAGLYMTDQGGNISELMAPQHSKIRHLITREDGVYFSSDRNGTNEIYLFNPIDRQLIRKTNTKYGVTEPFFLGEELYFAALQPHGKLLAKVDDEIAVQVDPADIHTYEIADKLSRQEDTVWMQTASHYKVNPPELTAPRKYNKLSNLFYIHSWLPFYGNNDHFSATYSEYDWEVDRDWGATAYFQNLTGTASGSLGLSIHENPAKEDNISAGFHARMQYKGLYPVFDFAFDIGDRPSAIFQHYHDIDRDSTFLKAFWDEDPRINRLHTYVGGQIKASLPLKFERGGWKTELKPWVAMRTSSDLYYFPARRVYYTELTDTYTETGDNMTPGVASSLYGEVGLNYVTKLAKAPSQVIPRWGNGVDLRYNTNLMTQLFYARDYAYLPGIVPGQGLKLSAEYQYSPMSPVTANSFWPTGAENLAPRGFEKTNLGLAMNRYCPEQLRLSADYVIQAFSIDTHITPYVYIRNFEFTPFVDYTWVKFMDCGSSLPGEDVNFYSAGMDVVARLEKLLFINNPVRIGVRFAVNGGSGKDWANEQGFYQPMYIGFLLDLVSE